MIAAKSTGSTDFWQKHCHTVAFAEKEGGPFTVRIVTRFLEIGESHVQFGIRSDAM